MRGVTTEHWHRPKRERPTIARARLLLRCTHCGESKLISVTIEGGVMGEVICESCSTPQSATPFHSAAVPADLDSSLLDITREQPHAPELDGDPSAERPHLRPHELAPHDRIKPRFWSNASERRRFAALVVMSLGFTGHTEPYWIDVVDSDLAADRVIDYSMLRRAADKHLRGRLVAELGLSDDVVDVYLPRDAALG
jgi:transcription elongation factor Elf1